MKVVSRKRFPFLLFDTHKSTILSLFANDFLASFPHAASVITDSGSEATSPRRPSIFSRRSSTMQLLPKQLSSALSNASAEVVGCASFM